MSAFKALKGTKLVGYLPIIDSFACKIRLNLRLPIINWFINKKYFPELEKETLYQDLNDNWHFEKKLDSGSSSVTMLIPSPNEVTKPKIGDVEVDELSDLSDVEVEPVHGELLKKSQIKIQFPCRNIYNF